MVISLLITPLAFSDALQIRNMGLIGFNETNQEYTSLRTVILETNYSANAIACRYKNNNSQWSGWEECTPEKYWLLPDGPGNKIVYLQINYSNSTNTTYNDTIYYNYTGAGLDTSSPGTVMIYDGDYSNSNTSINFSWSSAADPESSLLGIPIIYSWIIRINNSPVTNWSSWGTARSASYAYNLNSNDTITIIVNASNSAALQSSTTSDGLLIDLADPTTPVISSSLTNSTWHKAGSVFFNWTASDSISGIGGFSYTFSTVSTVSPDDVPEGPSGAPATHKNNTFTGVETGKYQFKIKAKDKAGNWGNTSGFEVWIDNTPPTKPVMTKAEKVYGKKNLTFSWSRSFDEDSGVANYTLEI